MHLFVLPFFFSEPFLVSVSIIFFVLLFLASTTKKSPLPPSPPKLPIIGNLHQLISSLPHRSLLALSNKYGPLMLFQLGQVPTLVVSSSTMACEVMKIQDNIFANRPTLRVPQELLYQGKDITFAPYGEYWRQIRKVAVLHLLSSKRVRSFKLVREEEVNFMIDKVHELSNSGGEINLSEILNSSAKDINCRLVLGKCLKEEDGSIGTLIQEASRLLGAFHWGDYVPWLGWMNKINGLDGRVRKTFVKGDEFLDSIVESRATRVEGIKESDAFVDVLLSLEKELSRSLPFDKQNIKAIIEDVFGAGTDSTYISMEWIMTELIQNPNVMKKLKQEIKSIIGSQRTVTEDNLLQMNFLKAVIKETFRLHPPGPLLVPRESMQDTEIQGYRIPKHTRVIVNAFAISRDPKVWQSPENFWPERFFGSEIDFKGHDCQLIPFGAGRRVCPGIQFAVAIIELAIANLVHRFDWKLPGNMKGENMDMTEAPGLTCRKNVILHAIATQCC